MYISYKIVYYYYIMLFIGIISRMGEKNMSANEEVKEFELGNENNIDEKLGGYETEDNYIEEDQDEQIKKGILTGVDIGKEIGIEVGKGILFGKKIGKKIGKGIKRGAGIGIGIGKGITEGISKEIKSK